MMVISVLWIFYAIVMIFYTLFRAGVYDKAIKKNAPQQHFFLIFLAHFRKKQ